MTDKGVPRFVWVIAAIGLLGLAIGGGVTYEVYMQRQAQQARAACVSDVLNDFVKATNERTTYTEELSAANENQLEAFNDLVLASLEKPPPGEKEAREIVINYRDALAAYFKVSDKAQKKRENFPYPTAQEVAACR